MKAIVHRRQKIWICRPMASLKGANVSHASALQTKFTAKCICPKDTKLRVVLFIGSNSCIWWVRCGLWGFQGFGYQAERSASEHSVLQEPWALQQWDPCLTIFHFIMSSIISGGGNGSPLQCSCLENPRDGGVWWAAVYGVAQSRTRLKRLSSSSIISAYIFQTFYCTMMALKHRGDGASEVIQARPQNSLLG